MITRSLSHRRHWQLPLAGECRRPVVGLKRKGIFLRRGGARCPGPARAGNKAEGARVSSNYWSSTTYQNNSNNAWNVNFNDGNVNPDNKNKNNNNYVRAVRGGS